MNIRDTDRDRVRIRVRVTGCRLSIGVVAWVGGRFAQWVRVGYLPCTGPWRWMKSNGNHQPAHV